MADVEDRRAARPERREQIGDPRHRIRIVASLARCLPFVECALDVDDDEGGEGMGHGVRIPEFACCVKYASRLGRSTMPIFPRFATPSQVRSPDGAKRNPGQIWFEARSRISLRSIRATRSTDAEQEIHAAPRARRGWRP